MGNKIVLIVEDSSAIKFQVKSLLEQIHVDLRQAGGEIGLFNLIDQYSKLTDLIIMDLTLKNENNKDQRGALHFSPSGLHYFLFHHISWIWRLHYKKL